MKTVLIGNDVRFECRMLKADGSGVDLTGYEVGMSVRSDYVAPVQLEEVTVEGNVVRGLLRGGMQRMLGYYSVTVTGVMNGKESVWTADRVLRLTDGMEGLEDVEENGVTVGQDMTVVVPRDGLSAYEVWLAQGNTGSVEDFIESLSLSSEVAQELREEFQAKDGEIEGRVTELDVRFHLYKKALFSENLFNKDGNFIDGKYINGINDGKITTAVNESYSISDYIPVNAGKQYRSYRITEGGAFSVFFDKNLKAISTFKSTENPIAPEGAVWCRLSCVKAQIYNAVFAETESDITRYVPYTDSFDLETVRRNNNSRISLGFWNNEINKIIAPQGYTQSADGFAVTDFVAFDRKKGFVFKLQSSNNEYVSCVAFYDKDKNFISSYSNIDVEPTEHYINSDDIPEEVVYFKCTLQPSALPNNSSFRLYDDYVAYKEPDTLDTIIDNTNKINTIIDINNLTHENTVSKYFNLFDKDDPDYKENYFISNLGKEITNQYSAAYGVTGYIKLPNSYDCISINYEVGNVYCALYDKDKNFISSAELTKGNRKIDYVFGATYARFTILVIKKDTTMITIGLSETNIPYSSYGKVYELDKPTDDYIKGLIPTDSHISEIVNNIINSAISKYDNKYSASLIEGGELSLEGIPDSKNHYGIGCTFNMESMGTVKIYKSQNDYCRGDIDIDATNITEYNGSTTNVIPHGLTITKGLIVSIIKGTKTTSVTLTNTAGEKVTKQLTKWIGCRGGEIKFIAVSGTYTNVTLSHSGTWMDKDTWIFGDSYTDFWPSKCYANGGTNFYLDGYSGRNAQGGYDSLILALKYGRPKRIVWMLGMNNADSDSAVNNSWNNVFTQLKELCETMNIQLIPCTIPNVPERIHTFKNQIIRASGLPYIDIASVLGANEKGSSWFEGLLGSDNVHPSTSGSEIIANAIIAGVPDIVD